MALSNLFGWNKKEETGAAAACGTACGAGDNPEEKPDPILHPDFWQLLSLMKQHNIRFTISLSPAI